MNTAPSIRQKVDAEFKREAVKLALESTDKPRAQIARDLGIAPKRLYKWIQQYQQNGEKAFPGNGHCIDETAALRRELKLVTQERDILKNAIGIFSQRPR